MYPDFVRAARRLARQQLGDASGVIVDQASCF
jgi:hypothetical protein